MIIAINDIIASFPLYLYGHALLPIQVQAKFELNSFCIIRDDMLRATTITILNIIEWSTPLNDPSASHFILQGAHAFVLRLRRQDKTDISSTFLIVKKVK